MGGLSIWHWLIALAVVLLLFGGRGKISQIMGDTAEGIKAFKKGMKDDKDKVESGHRQGDRQHGHRRKDNVAEALRGIARPRAQRRRGEQHVRYRLVRDGCHRRRGACRHRPEGAAGRAQDVRLLDEAGAQDGARVPERRRRDDPRGRAGRRQARRSPRSHAAGSTRDIENTIDPTGEVKKALTESELKSSLERRHKPRHRQCRPSQLQPLRSSQRQHAIDPGGDAGGRRPAPAKNPHRRPNPRRRRKEDAPEPWPRRSAEEDPNEAKKMPLLDHLIELRKRLFYAPSSS